MTRRMQLNYILIAYLLQWNVSGFWKVRWAEVFVYCEKPLAGGVSKSGTSGPLRPS